MIIQAKNVIKHFLKYLEYAIICSKINKLVN